MDEELQNNKIQNSQSRPKTQNYYPIPTLPSMQYKEQSQFTQSKYDGEGIYEWNINGISKHQIFNILQEMIIVAADYKARKNTDHMVVHRVAGFVGQLKG